MCLYHQCQVIQEAVVTNDFVLFLLFLDDNRREEFVNWVIELCGIYRAMLCNAVFSNFHM
jgi:hypothetical protein